jgi:hypothetical protein
MGSQLVIEEPFRQNLQGGRFTRAPLTLSADDYSLQNLRPCC